MSEELASRLLDDLPTAGAILFAWWLFARKHSEGLAAIHQRIDRFLTNQTRLFEKLVERLDKDNDR